VASRDSRREDGDGGAGRLASAAAARVRDGTRARRGLNLGILLFLGWAMKTRSLLIRPNR